MWAFIEAANWAKRSQEKRGYEAVKKFLMDTYTQAVNKKIVAFIDERFGELDDAIVAYEKRTGVRAGGYGGDDSYGDMISHAIGLGQEYFETVLAYPVHLEGLDFVESFAYCLPHDDDYEKLEPDFRKARGVEAIQEIARIIKDNNPDTESLETMRQMLNRFVFMAGGDFAEAKRGWSDDRFNEYYKFSANDRQAMFSNYLSDL